MGVAQDDDRRAVVQRRTLVVLFAAQVIGAVGVSATIAVGALMASRVLGRDDLAGLVQSAQVLGSAVLAIPAARLAATRGRRVGLSLGFLCGLLGTLLAVVAAETRLFWLLLVGATALGGGTTAGLQARFAATDLATPQRRARSLGLIVWASTLGAVLGPNLIGPTSRVAEALSLHPLAGPYLLGAAAMGLAAAVTLLGLRPDPWLFATRLAAAAAHEPAAVAAGPGRTGARRSRPSAAAGPPHPMRHGLRAVAASPSARLALGAVALAHTVMVSVMVMTPIHMDHGGASLEVIGIVISVHVAGMFAFAPVMGWLSDLLGRVVVLGAGAATLIVACALAATSPEGSSAGLSSGLFLLGLGWSACLVAGSTLLTESVGLAERPIVGGVSDVVMGLSAAGGGAISGLVVAGPGYATLAWIAAVICVAALGWLLLSGRRGLRPAPTASPGR